MRNLTIPLLLLALVLAGCGGSSHSQTRTIPLEGSGAYAHHGPLDEPPAILAKRDLARLGPVGAFTNESLVWSGGTEPLSSGWATMSDEVPGHCAVNTSPSTLPDKDIKVIADPRFGPGPVVSYHEEANDHSCYGGRTETQGNGNPYTSSRPDRRVYPGHTYWFGFRALPKADYMSAAGSASGGLIQCHRDGAGKSPFGMGILGSERASVFYINSAGSFLEQKLAPVVKAEAVENYLIEYNAAEANGSFRVFMSEAGKPLVEVDHVTGVPTITGSPDCFLTNGIYRGIYTGEHAPLTLEIAGWNVGQSRGSVEALAGETSTPPPEPTKTEPTTSTETTPVPPPETTPTPPPPAPPVTPANVTVTPASGPTVKITASPSPGATGYNVYRAGRNYPGHANGTPWGTSSSPSFSNAFEVEHGMWLCYRMSAVNASGMSPPSAPVCTTVP